MKNKKGYMLVELILASFIAFGIAMYLVSMTIKLKNKNDDVLVESLVTTDTSVATNSILKIINGNPNDFDCGLISVDSEKNTIKYNGNVVAIFSEYANLKESLSYCKDDGLDGSAQIYIGVDVPQIPDKDFNIVIDYIKRKQPDPTIIFEGVGNYGYAIAGSNNASRGTAPGANDYDFIMAPPNDTAKYQKILAEIKTKYGITNVNNISGSKLDTHGGTVIKAVFNYYAYGTNTEAFDGKILFIRPDYTYDLIPYEKKGWGFAEYLDISDYINKRNPDGWYYVAFIGARKAAQTAWSMTTIYNDDDVPFSYTKLVLNERVLEHETLDIQFKTFYELKGSYQLTGTIIAGGKGAWPDSWEVTGDQVFAILDDGSTKQLYETTYKGKKIFEGRTDNDFACDIFNTEKNHNIRGGEIDIFYETLDNDFFGGKKLVGLRIFKNGTGGFVAGLAGVSMSIDQDSAIQ